MESELAFNTNAQKYISAFSKSPGVNVLCWKIIFKIKDIKNAMKVATAGF